MNKGKEPVVTELENSKSFKLLLYSKAGLKTETNVVASENSSVFRTCFSNIWGLQCLVLTLWKYFTMIILKVYICECQQESGESFDFEFLGQTGPSYHSGIIGHKQGYVFKFMRFNFNCFHAFN